MSEPCFSFFIFVSINKIKIKFVSWHFYKIKLLGGARTMMNRIQERSIFIAYCLRTIAKKKNNPYENVPWWYICTQTVHWKIRGFSQCTIRVVSADFPSAQSSWCISSLTKLDSIPSILYRCCTSIGNMRGQLAILWIWRWIFSCSIWLAWEQKEFIYCCQNKEFVFG